MAAPTSRTASAGPRESAPARSAKRFIVGIAAIAALGGALFGYDTGVVSGALPFMESHFGLTSLGEGIITSALLIGAAFGSLAGGRMSDALGRRASLLWAGAVFIGGAVAVALAPTVPFMAVARFVLGLAVGSASVITPLYLSEIAPPHIRGRLVSFNSLMIVSGQLLAYLVNAVLAHWEAWRWMLGLAALPAVALFVGLFFLPDTPRWYISKGRPEDAAAVLRRTLPAEDVADELARIAHARDPGGRGPSRRLAGAAHRRGCGGCCWWASVLPSSSRSPASMPSSTSRPRSSPPRAWAPMPRSPRPSPSVPSRFSRPRWGCR